MQTLCQRSKRLHHELVGHLLSAGLVIGLPRRQEPGGPTLDTQTVRTETGGGYFIIRE